MDAAKTMTQLLEASVSGDPKAAEDLIPLVYNDLRALAQKHFRHENKGHTLQATALVNEAFIRLVQGEEVDWKGRSHFFAVAAKTLRRLLVDHARTKKAEKRGGKANQISLVDPGGREGVDMLDVIALDEALAKLTQEKPRHAKLVELRYFAGLTVDETAQALDISKDTAKLDWRFARAWLNRELTRGEVPESEED